MKKIISVSILVVVLAGCGGNGSKEVRIDAGENTFTNPLKESGADPWVFYHEGFYYYTNTSGRRIGVWRTKDITELRDAEHKTIYVPPENTTGMCILQQMTAITLTTNYTFWRTRQMTPSKVNLK